MRDSKSWRYGRICKAPTHNSIGANYQEGDLIIFPNVYGVHCGEVMYANFAGETKLIKHGTFLSANRIFAKVKRRVENGI